MEINTMRRKWRIRVGIAAVIVAVLTGFALGQAAKGTEPASKIMDRLESALAKAADYDFGSSRVCLSEIEQIVQIVLNSPGLKESVEKRFIAFLRSDATIAGKQFICRKLSVVGSGASVPELSRMLKSEETYDMALYALTRIPSSRADRVLRERIPKVSGRFRLGLVNALGYRRDSKAVSLLETLIGEDPETTGAALSALGHIATPEAAEVLARVMEEADGPVRIEAMNAYLKYADRLVEDGRIEQALTIYRRFAVPDRVRAAALTGMIHARPGDARKIILETLRGDDSRMKTVALGHLSRCVRIENLKKIAKERNRLESHNQVQLLTALGVRGDRSVLPLVVEAVESEDEAVRVAAVKALAFLGDATTVDLLARLAAGEGVECEAARESLDRIHGEEVDEKIVNMLAGSDPEIRVELLRSMGERVMRSGIDTVLAYTRNSDRRVRVQAVRTAGLIAAPERLPDVIDALVRAESEPERQEGEKAIVAVARNIEDQENQARDILAAMPNVTVPETRASMLHVLGWIGDSNGLPVVRKSLDSDDPVIRKAGIKAMSDWPNSAPMEDLWRVAQAEGQKVDGVLSLRGYIGLVRRDRERPNEEKVGLYRKAFDLAKGLEEKRLVLSALGENRSLAALEMAGTIMDTPDLQPEAEVAVFQVARRIWRDHPGESAGLLEKVVEKTDNEELRAEAEDLIGRIREEM
jgi:HEAT repeat protein